MVFRKQYSPTLNEILTSEAIWATLKTFITKFKNLK